MTDEDATGAKIHYEAEPLFRSTENNGVQMMHIPENRSKMRWHTLDVNGMRVTALQITSPYLPPNRWYRFWARVLLGVTWEPIDES